MRIAKRWRWKGREEEGENDYCSMIQKLEDFPSDTFKKLQVADLNTPGIHINGNFGSNL
jgi:hypothetical protein